MTMQTGIIKTNRLVLSCNKPFNLQVTQVTESTQTFAHGFLCKVQLDSKLKARDQPVKE